MFVTSFVQLKPTKRMVAKLFFIFYATLSRRKSFRDRIGKELLDKIFLDSFRIEASCQDREFIISCKRRVVQFVHCWVLTIGDPVFEEPCTHTFLQVK